uniref:Aspartyl beta-hydroxylase/Triadin domain-containing protein n=1 Tax=Buteo japonicus TaxID=224669 RepID=A0A8C0BCC3_9AVES
KMTKNNLKNEAFTIALHCSPGPGSKRETKHGGSKNGKKEGLSGSLFFTWFMVIALLGVWMSVAVVWFELVDYEEVLGKLGIYDADGHGDFDVEDAKNLHGLNFFFQISAENLSSSLNTQ